MIAMYTGMYRRGDHVWTTDIRSYENLRTAVFLTKFPDYKNVEVMILEFGKHTIYYRPAGGPVEINTFNL